MNDGLGRFAVGANSSIVKQFMEGGLFSAPGEYKASVYFSKEQLGIAYQQYLYNDLAGDFTEIQMLFLSLRPMARERLKTILFYHTMITLILNPMMAQQNY